MPLGNDGRARRPMPRQLDMSDWGSPATEGGDHIRSESGITREADDFNYRLAREASNRFDTFREGGYRSRPSYTRAESQRPNEGEAAHTSAYDTNSFSSERSTFGSSAFDATFTTIPSSGDPPGGGNSTYRSDRESNVREVDSTFRGGDYAPATWSRHHEPWTSDRSSRRSFPSSAERSDAHSTVSSSYVGDARSFGSRTSDSYGNNGRSRLSTEKADSIRQAESPKVGRTSRHEDEEPPREAPEIKISSLASSENQDEHLSPSNSEIPASPYSVSDSIAKRIDDRYPKPSSIPSPASTNKSASAGRRFQPSSPCSSVSTTKTSSSRASSNWTKQFDTPQRTTSPALSDLREDLYAFRKQMREVFIRVEDVVDVHRSLFKSDPSTGSPVLNKELHQEAEQLATDAFEHLADLRNLFTRLAKDFQRSEQRSENRTRPDRRLKNRKSAAQSPTRMHRVASNQDSNSKNTSIKCSEMPEDDCSDEPDHLSVGSDNNDHISSREHSPIIHEKRDSFHDDNNAISPATTPPDSVRSPTSSYLSSQLQSRWRNFDADSESTAESDISARTKSRARSPIITSNVSSLQDQCSKTSEPDTDSIFKDFDKRMEQIRCSLNAIASGKKSSVSVASTNFTSGGAGSPIRAMMDATRTRSTLREASRISRQLNEKDESDGKKARAGSREDELRQLLQELNHINGANVEDD